MNLTFSTFSECLSAFEVIDGSSLQSPELAPCLIFKNIRAFKDWSVVPLSKLNVLTGPNSSGKSTLAKLITAFNGETFRESVQSLADEVQGNAYVGFAVDWRELGRPRNPYWHMQNEMFAFQYLDKLAERFLRSNPSFPGRSHPRRLIYIVESAGEFHPFRVYLYGDSECLAVFAFGSVWTEGDELDNEFTFKMSPSLLRQLFTVKSCTALQGFLETLETDLPRSRKSRLGNKELTGSTALKSPEYVFETANNAFDFYRGATMALGEDIVDIETAGVTYLLLNTLVRDPLYLMHRFSCELLPSLRPISSPEQLTYRYKSGGQRYSDTENADTASAFSELARMLADGKLITGKRGEQRSGRQALADINQWAKVILGGPHQLGCRVSSMRIAGKNSAAEVELFVLGHNKKELALADVGTGVSQVLPVIAAIGAIPWGTILPRAIAISQPELHLHPRAQSSLGDLFITAMNKGASLTIETHSEHLILRFLRRIKARSGRKAPLRIGEADLSLIYLHPTKHATEIYWIRVDDKGEFIDAWPAGFFENRYEDIFFERT